MDATVASICHSGRGILAADESTATIGKRFDNIKLPNTEENRKAYRSLLFTTPGNVGDFIAGAILYEETLFQNSNEGAPMIDLMKAQGVIPGIKVDKGVVNLPGAPGEVYTVGLDGLGKKCAEYYARGARFAKWRAVYTITDSLPSSLSIKVNAEGLAFYAATCQENGLVPIVEPEILMDGTHSIERSAAVTEAVLSSVFASLHEHHVDLSRILLKPNMVLSGYSAANRASPQQVAEATVKVLLAAVPPAVRGIVFLSGGQEEAESTLHLDLMNKILGAHRPWALSFSYGRALQHSAIEAWGGKPENVGKGQDAYYKRAKLNSLASKGQYDSSME